MSENQNIEWKASWRDEYLKWVCGFANAQGGVLEIGKNDRGKVVSLPHASKLLEDLPNKIRDLLGIIVDVDLQNEAGKEFIRITVEPYPYPISYKGEYHYRSGSTKQVLKGAALDHFLLRKTGKHWDGVPVPGLTVGNLDSRAIDRFRELAARSKRVGPEVLVAKNEVLIGKLRLTDGDYLNRAAVLLFHSDPESFVTGAYIKIGYFKSNTDLRFHDEIHGDLFTQVDKTMELLLTKYLQAAISYEGIYRVENYPIPENALREAVLNAIVHKDYSSSVPIQISVYDDRAMIWNNGRLPGDWTVDRLLGQHPSIPFNPDIANAFFRAGSIEAWGQGIERILTECKAMGTPIPIFRYETIGLWVEFPYLMPERADQKTSGKTSGKTSEKMLSLMKQNPDITISVIAKTLGKGTRAIEMQLAKLKALGKIERIGPDKGGHWHVVGEDNE